jgi:hypothetical protein
MNNAAPVDTRRTAETLLGLGAKPEWRGDAEGGRRTTLTTLLNRERAA